MNFNNKKILFISPRFFNYETAIQKRLIELGAKVDFFDERPSNSIISKGVIRVYPRLFHLKIKQYYQQILKKIETEKYDFLLLIKGESVPFEFLEEFKENHPQTLMIFYAYDSVQEYPKMKTLMRYFDRNLSFEPKDVLAYSFGFRPVFYLDTYHSHTELNEKKYDLVFIGSAHSDRYQIGEKIKVAAQNLNLNSYFYYYMPNRWVYFLKRMFDRNFKNFEMKSLSFQKLSHEEIGTLYQQSFSVVDLNKPFQLGVSNRIYEALAAGKKVITTNHEIKKYPFYDANNILIIDRAKVELPESFFQTPFRPLSKNILYSISLDAWLNDVFFEIQTQDWSIVLNSIDPQ